MILRLISFGCASLAAVLFVLVVTGTTDHITSLSFSGQLPAMFNIPLAEPILMREGYQYSDYAVMARSVLLAVGAVLALIAIAVFVAAKRPALAKKALSWTINASWAPTALYLAFFSLVMFSLFSRFGWEGAFVSIDDMMNVTANPPYVHRQLLPTVARFFQDIVPSMSNWTAFRLSQLLVIVALFFALQAWGGAIAGKTGRAVVPFLMVAVYPFWAHYFTPYDLAIVLFFTLGLLLLWKGRVIGYLVTIAVATFNHEVILFLILVSGFLLQPFGRRWGYDFKFVALQCVIHFGVRALLLLLIPVDRASSLGNIWINIHFLGSLDREALSGTFGVLLFVALSAFGLRTAPHFLVKAWLILPLLVISTLLVGQLNEARQFAGFLPVAFASILYLLPFAAKKPSALDKMSSTAR